MDTRSVGANAADSFFQWNLAQQMIADSDVYKRSLKFAKKETIGPAVSITPEYMATDPASFMESMMRYSMIQ